MKIKTVLVLIGLMNLSVFYAQKFDNTDKPQIDPQEFLQRQLAKPKLEFTEVEKKNIADTSGYKIKSGKIIYEFTNGAFEGTMELIFDDYGKLQSEHETKTFRNDILYKLPHAMRDQMQKIEQSLIIKRYDTVFTYDYKSDLPKTSIDTSDQKKKNLITQALLERNVQPIKNEFILEKEATQVNYFNEYIIWFWKGLILKQEKIVGPNARQTEYKTAISIDENYVPKQSDFEKR